MRLEAVAATAAFSALASSALAESRAGVGGVVIAPSVHLVGTTTLALDIRESCSNNTAVACGRTWDVFWPFEQKACASAPSTLRSNDPIRGAGLSSVVQPAFMAGYCIGNFIADLAVNRVTGDPRGVGYGDEPSRLFVIDTVDASRSAQGIDDAHVPSNSAAISFSNDGYLCATSSEQNGTQEVDTAMRLAVNSWFFSGGRPLVFF